MELQICLQGLESKQTCKLGLMTSPTGSAAASNLGVLIFRDSVQIYLCILALQHLDSTTFLDKKSEFWIVFL